MKKPMSTIDPSRLLQMRSSIINQNQALQRAAGQGGIGAAGGGVEGGGAPDFGAAINHASQQVHAQQATVSHITEAYERAHTPALDTVITEPQKPSPAFKTTRQTRTT